MLPITIVKTIYRIKSRCKEYKTAIINNYDIINNVEKIPDIIRASWSHEDKLREFIEIIKKHEIALNGCDFVIRQWPDKVTSMICREQNI